jgi:hypothetical protein
MKQALIFLFATILLIGCADGTNYHESLSKVKIVDLPLYIEDSNFIDTVQMIRGKRHETHTDLYLYKDGKLFAKAVILDKYTDLNTLGFMVFIATFLIITIIGIIFISFRN